MDFIVGLPMTARHHDAIMVTFDFLTKVVYFPLIKSSYTIASIANIFMHDIVRLHGIPQKIILDRDTVFTFAFWTSQ